jgi:tRNA (guanine-N7-)-methyltransferase
MIMPHQLTLNMIERFTSRDFDKTRLPPSQVSLKIPKDHKPLDVEIGCGVGMHPILRAHEYPDRTLIAIEHTKEKFEKFERRIQAHHHPKNLLALHANAISVISHQLNSKSVDQFFLLYPNPYPKISDRKKRWVFLPFMKEMLHKLKIGGRLIVATNEIWYAEEVWLMMELAHGMTTCSIERLDHLTRPRTHFEAKYLARGEICLNMVFMKSS